MSGFEAFGFAGETALVTGSTGGIGYAIVVALAKAGVKTVFVNGRTEERVKEAIEKAKKDSFISSSSSISTNILAAVGDLTNKESREIMWKNIEEQLKDISIKEEKSGDDDIDKITILVNNVGVFPVKDFFDITDDEWDDIWSTNVMTGVRCSRKLLPGMLKNNWGRIIFVSSESGLNIPPEMIHYGVTKTCQISLAAGLAQLTKGSGVTVNSVLPGPTLTAGVEKWAKENAEKDGISIEEVKTRTFAEGSRAGSLKGTFLTVEEIANTVLFVASKLSSATNGATIRAEGGVLKFL